VSQHEAIRLHCKALRLPTIAEVLTETLALAEREAWPLDTFLLQLFEQELAGRQERRTQRLLSEAHLPEGKTLAGFDQARLPLRIRRAIPELTSGALISRAENLLCFGLPGTGKTHLLAALGYAWVNEGYRVLFTPTYKLVDGLLRAKRDFALEPELRRLDRFEVVILDDIGYVQQSREEMEVLFTFLAERYERRSVAITSNLVFSEWSKIFKDPLTTAAAIDRVVHHATIIEFGAEIPSYRAEQANRHQRRAVELAPTALPAAEPA
jgi:DNA replication protein DnaC